MKQEAIVKKTATEITSDIRPPGGDGPSLTETIFESNDFRGATPGVWPTGRGDDDKPDRGGALQSTQRHSVSSERLRDLPVSGTLPPQRPLGRGESRPQGRSEQP